MNTIFKIQAKLPANISELTIYSTLQQQEDRDRNIVAREEKLNKVFGMKAKSTDIGDKLLKIEKNKSLSLYLASDSFWYQDNDLFASENKKFSKTLPDKKTAEDLAKRFLTSNELLLPNAEFRSISYTTVAVNTADSKVIDEYNTEVHANFGYTLDKLPVFGPGAKTRVSLVDSNTNSGVYHFWREVKALEKRKVVNSELALEIFSSDFRFRELKTDVAKVVVSDIQLGYYAMSPTDIQNFLIPVYKVSGTVSTEALPEYGFNHYVVAVKYSVDDVKGNGVNIGSANAMVF